METLDLESREGFGNHLFMDLETQRGLICSDLEDVIKSAASAASQAVGKAALAADLIMASKSDLITRI